MPPSKGPGWDQIIILAPEFTIGTRLKGRCKVQCKHCLPEFTEGASRVRDHYVHSTLVLALMQREHKKRVHKEQESAAN